MTTVKEMQFPVWVRWRGGRLVNAEAGGRDGLELATPPQFTGGLAGYWSPEDLLVAATASCFALTLAAVAERRETPLLDATVTATGRISRRADGRFGFAGIEIEAELETIAGGEDAVRSAARAAEQRCLVAHALDLPVAVTVHTKTVVSSQTPPAGARR
jgi:organic hydroperoxide reductase OsmC/OhrA